MGLETTEKVKEGHRMSQVIKINTGEQKTDRIATFRCPGCKCIHTLTIDAPNHWGARWSWNGSVEKPTFSPSYVERVGPYPECSSKAGQIDVCHSFIRDGNIEFLGDCTHDLRGRTVPLDPILD